MVGTKGSVAHLSSGPGGTTSVWPASTTRGRASPWRIHKLATSPCTITSGRNPRGARRSMMSRWQPSSAGVTDLRAISALASSRVSFFKAGVSVGRAARDDGADALLDMAGEGGLGAEGEEHLGAEEEGTDEELLHVVVERG